MLKQASKYVTCNQSFLTLSKLLRAELLATEFLDRPLEPSLLSHCHFLGL
jgi:hypothetical protein